MWIQILIILLAFLYLKVCNPDNTIQSDDVRSRKNYAVFITVLCILQSGLRNVAVGADTYAYKVMYDEASESSWSQVFMTIRNVYLGGEGNDAGYLVFEKLSSYIFVNYQLFLFLVAVLFFVPLWRLIYRNTNKSVDLFYALLLYQALFYEFFSITGIRQTLATALCLWSVDYIKSRKLMPYLVCILVGAFIHKSCLLFLPMFWIGHFKKVYLLYILAFISLPFMFEAGRSFMAELVALSATEKYTQYLEDTTTGAFTLSFFYIGMTLMLFYFYRRDKNFLIENSLVANALSVGLFFLPLTFVSAALTRIMQYFSIFLLVGISYYLEPQYKTNSRFLFFVCIIITLIYKIIRSNYVYGFFWETMQLGSNY